MKTYTLDLNIDELVLDGFDDVDRERLGTALERELTRLFTERGVSPALRQGGHAPRLDGGTFNAAPNAGAEALGAQIARTVYGGLNA